MFSEVRHPPMHGHPGDAEFRLITVAVISRTCLTLSDMLVILVTWYKLYRLQQGCLGITNWSIAGVFLRDGWLNRCLARSAAS